MEFATYVAMAVTIAAVLEMNLLALLGLLHVASRDREMLAELEGLTPERRGEAVVPTA